MILQSTTLKGSLHAEYGVANQDAVLTKEIAGYACAAVCDGVSLKSDWTFSNSEIASSLCAKSAISYLETALTSQIQSNEIPKILEKAFAYANQTLQEQLKKREIPILDCQTTMILAVYRKGILYGGIAGDGGIIYQTKSGRTSMMVTHLKVSAAVYPIRCEEQWRFFEAGSEIDPVTKVLVATDGVFDQLISVQDGQVVSNPEEIENLLSIGSIPRKQRDRWLKKNIDRLPGNDDKTIALLIDATMKKPLR